MKSGAAQFKEWMQRRCFTQREAAKHFEWDETFVSQLVTGRRTPGLTNAVAIERETGIAVEAWLPTAQDKTLVGASTGSRKSKQDRT